MILLKLKIKTKREEISRQSLYIQIIRIAIQLATYFFQICKEEDLRAALL